MHANALPPNQSALLRIQAKKFTMYSQDIHEAEAAEMQHDAAWQYSIAASCLAGPQGGSSDGRMCMLDIESTTGQICSRMSRMLEFWYKCIQLNQIPA
jgi:nicotinamide mononucleotide (NMN) deamidase PncC